MYVAHYSTALTASTLTTVATMVASSIGNSSSTTILSQSNNNNNTTPSRQGKSPEIKRRTSRLELQDKEWDGLFQHNSTKAATPQPQHSTTTANPDLEHARAVAEAKLAATPTRRTPTRRNASSKRKTPATKRDEIFRARRFDAPGRTATPNPTSQPPQQGNSFLRFLNNHQGVTNALCFAMPIRDEDDDDEEDDAPLNEPDDDSTLNTCEDTITSTLYYGPLSMLRRYFR